MLLSQWLFCSMTYLNILGYFLFFQASGLVDLGPKSLNRSNATNTEKKM